MKAFRLFAVALLLLLSAQSIFAGRYYDSKTGRFLSADPMAHKFPGVSPFAYANNNPLVNIDPNGLEWYHYQKEGEDGKKWHYHEDTPEKEIWGSEYNDNGTKKMVMTAGIVELLSFNGKQITLHEANGYESIWNAVSGNLDENGNVQPSKQWVENVGPIPEGWYSADPALLQKWSDLSFFDQMASTISPIVQPVFGKQGAWPGGTFAWGQYRLPLTPKTVGNRSNFFIHGGSVPGSAGCIDLTNFNNAFFSSFMKYNKKLKLHVSY